MRQSALATDQSKITIKLARGHRRHEFALAPGLAYILFGLAPLLLMCGLGLGAYALFRDDMLASLMRRQAQMQFAYEDRIATLRSQIDSIASRQMLNQDSFEGKVAELAVRQARLESRSALVAALAAKVQPGEAKTQPGEGSTVVRRAPAATAPSEAWSSPAPTKQPSQKPALAGEAPKLQLSPAAKPTPEGFDLRRTQPLDSQGEDVSDNVGPESADPESATARLRNLADNFERMEKLEVAALDGLRAPAAVKAERLRVAFSEAGLPVDRMIRHAAALHPGKPLEPASAVGGPYEPATADAQSPADARSPIEALGDFARAYASVSQSLATIDGLRDALPFAPLRQPLPGPLDMTSSFGYRTDPFLGRPALHSGMDLRGDYGAAIHATAAGRVSVAGPSGGYGNMVEIDHGAGLATRYGHMSQIDVAEGQWVGAGAIIGRIGSTGRSTGPHLHYEVRVDGAAVDPSRYLKAGKILNSAL
jgi:murein DD-endopeptidase MepM/ murein hydrolase activator NlpD